MSALGLMENTADIAQTTPTLSAVPSTTTERLGADWAAAQTPDRYWNADAARARRADKIIDDLYAQTGEKLKNPYGMFNTPTADEARENAGQPMSVIYDKRLEKLREATRNARAGLEQLGGLPQDYLDVDSIDTSIAQESGARRAAAARLVGTGGGLGAFAGSTLGEMASPHGIASAFIPVSRIPTGIVQATLGGFVRNVGKEALLQSGAGMALQAAGSALDYGTRKAFGTEQTTEEIIQEIIGAGVGGALLGGTFRGVHLGILKLRSRGVEIHPEALDAAVVEAGAELHGNRNPFGVHPGVNEANIDGAVADLVQGRAATPDVGTPAPTLHDAARRLEPELMQRYDAAIAARDEARAQLAPDDATIAKLKERADAADAAIAAAGPQTREAAERLGQQARMAHELHDDAVARANAQGIGAPIETAHSESLRQQLQAADLELRDLIPEINAVMKRAGEDLAAPVRDLLAPDAAAPGALPPVPEGHVRVWHGGGQNPNTLAEIHVAGQRDYAAGRAGERNVWYADVPADSPWLRKVEGTDHVQHSIAPQGTVFRKADQAGLAESRLTPEEVSRVRELQDQIPEYQRLRDAATTPEDKAAWQQAIDDFHGEIAHIMDLDVVRAGLKQLAPAMAEQQALGFRDSLQVRDAQRPFVAQPAEPTPGRPAGITPEDKARDSQVKLLLERPDGASPAQREAYAKALQDEKETNVALSCVGGAPI